MQKANVCWEGGIACHWHCRYLEALDAANCALVMCTERARSTRAHVAIRCLPLKRASAQKPKLVDTKQSCSFSDKKHEESTCQNQSNSKSKTENQILFWLSQLSAKKMKPHFQTTLPCPQNDQHCDLQLDVNTELLRNTSCR
jgi:hypothetical protein